jgi:DNA-binding beta-propeller fold protein YncE
MPSGEGSEHANYWLVLDAATGEPTGSIEHVSSPHNTIVSIDGRYAFLEGQEYGDQPDEWLHTVAVVDTQTDTVIRRVGPFKDVIRPFTVSGDSKYMFACLNNFVGFEVANVETGEVLFTVSPPGVTQPEPIRGETPCHGIAITPDERFLFLNDRVSGGVQVFDISGMRYGEAPKHLKFIATRETGRDLNGNIDPAAREDTDRMPGWLAVSYDGRHVYPESGEIIDVETLEIVGFLKGEKGLYTHSKFMAEVVFDNGQAVRANDQFGVGRVR